MADGAYWFDVLTGKFISSTYYKPGLPAWLDKFNAQNLADQYLNKEWKTLLPIEQYTESGPDDSPYESKLRKDDRPVFPCPFFSHLWKMPQRLVATPNCPSSVVC